MDIAEKMLSREIKEYRSPSVQYAFFERDRIIKRYVLGYADLNGKKEVDSNTTYNAYSVTKTFTALAVLQLAQQRKLDIDHSAKNYLTYIPYSSEITIRHLLSHSSGIPNPIPLNWVHLPGRKNFDRDKFFRDIIKRNNRTNSKPNEKFAYSNLGYVLLGQIIEKVSGLSYESYIRQNILNTLGRHDNELDFEIHDYGRHATGYHKRLSISNLILGYFIDKSELMDKPVSKWKPFKPFYVNGASYGGLIGTTDSFIDYIQMLLMPGSLLITDEYKKILFTENYTINNKPTGMSLSWFKGKLNGHTYFAHAGGGGGYYCEIRIYPDSGFGSVIFFNRTGMSDQRFLDRIDGYYLK